MNENPREAQLRRIWASSATLSERVGGALQAIPTPAAAAEGARRTERLQTVLATCGPGTLAECCAQFGIDADDLPAALAPQEALARAPLPAWAGLLGELLEPLALGEPDAARPFAEVLLPLQHRAENLLRQHLAAAGHWLPAHVLGTFGGALRERWERELAVALFSVFEVERSLTPLTAGNGRGPSVYADFVRRVATDGLGAVAERFPVAARLAAVQTACWLEAIGDLAGHLHADLPELQQLFGLPRPEIAALAWPLSDFHDGGRAVARVEFASGEVLYYKPADRSLDLGFDAFFRSGLVRRSVAAGPPLRAVVRPDHSWIEHLPECLPASRWEARELARDLGRLGAVALLLGTTDLHPGNLVAGGGWVRVCDAETALHPEAPEFPWTAPFLGEECRDLDNPFRSFLCSFRVADRPDVRLHSCLGEWASEPAKVRTLRWSHCGTDGLALEREFGVWPNAFAPVFAALQEQLGPRWAAALVAGAAEARACLAADPSATAEALARLAELPRRVIRRNTVAYVWMLAEARCPALLADGFERSLFLERMGVFNGDARLLEPWERAALERGDVPRLGVCGMSQDDWQRLAEPTRPFFSPESARRTGRALARELARPEGVTLRAG